MSEIEFPQTLAAEMQFLDWNWIAGGLSKTLILSLRSDGTRTTQSDPKARLGLYIWDGERWQLKGVYRSRQKAKSAANRARQGVI
jgi:hypothetical protein